jgi:hypothetical protein
MKKSVVITALVGVLSIAALVACEKNFIIGNYNSLSECLAAASGSPGGGDKWKPDDEAARIALCQQATFASASPSPSPAAAASTATAAATTAAPTTAAPSPTATATAAATTAAPTEAPTQAPTQAPATQAPTAPPRTPAPTPVPTPTPTPTQPPTAGVPGGIPNATGPVPAGFSRYGGTVVDNSTGLPIKGVCVYSGPPAGCPIQGTPRTDATGFFAIDYPASVQFLWTFEHPDYLGLLSQPIAGGTNPTFRLTHK